MLTRFFSPLLVLALVLPFAACETDTASENAVEEVAEDEIAPIDPAIGPPEGPIDENVTLDGTLDALTSGDLTAMPINAAVANINGWITKINDADFEGDAELVDNLQQLRDLLTDDQIDGPAVGDRLVRIGELTAVISNVAAPDAQAGLAQLGETLGQAGLALGGSAEDGLDADDDPMQ